MNSHTIQPRSALLRIAVLIGTILLLLLLAASADATTLTDTSSAPSPVVSRDGVFRYLMASRVVMPAGVIGRASNGRSIPSFSRQTKLACSVCHYGFPQLTPFGRLFKLNAYTLTGLATIEARDSTRETLKLAPFPPISAMVVTSLSRTHADVPGTQNNTAVFPDQLSVFLAGELTPNLGAFVQVTYAAPDAAIGLDNVDLRFADRTKLASRELLYGITLHNNPTVQDVWNTVPAWGFPFMASSVAPSPVASTLIDGGLGQQVLGLGAYGLWSKLVYAEFTAYRSAPQGVSGPLGAEATSVAHNVIPYWRLALQHQFGSSYVMLGTYGMVARLYPTGVSGPTDRFADLAADAQLEQKAGNGVVVVRSAYIHEQQDLPALVGAGAQNGSNTLRTFRLNASYMPTTRYNLSLGYFNTSGTSDTLLFAPGALSGSSGGSPNSSGGIGEFDFNAWQNTRVGLQYVAYDKFNGASHNYDGAGRNASDNNTLFLFAWLAF